VRVGKAVGEEVHSFTCQYIEIGINMRKGELYCKSTLRPSPFPSTKSSNVAPGTRPPSTLCMGFY